MSPHGTRIYVTGDGYAAVAYSAATGKQLWVSSHDGRNLDSADSVAVNPAGTTVYVSGNNFGRKYLYVTVAYRA